MWVLAFFALLLVALFTGYIADEKGYDRIQWLLPGFLFGPLGMFAAVGLPDKKLRRYIRAGFENLFTLGVDTRPQSYPMVKKGPFNASGDLPAIPPLPEP